MNPLHLCSTLDEATQGLEVRTATTELEISQLREALKTQHYLGAGRPAGHVLWQGVYQTATEESTPSLCAVLCWAGAALRLKDRDEWIDWDPLTRANRLALVVQLRRFLVLEESRKPNLASRCMGLAMRRLPEQWEARHGFRPLLAESFSDPQTHQGTIYKASNWTPLGFTKGFKRHRADFYQDDEHPKKLWIKTLHPKAQQLLASPGELPEVHAKGVREVTAGARCALSCAHLRSLSDAFENVPDPRDPLKCRHRLRAMLTLIVHGLLCGAPDVKAIWRRAGPLNEQQRRAVGLTWRDKSGRLAMPGYDAINDVINAIDPDKLAAALNTWLVANHDNLPQSLAIDGKDLGHKLGAIVTLCRHDDGRPVLMQSYSGKKEDCELPVAQKLLADNTGVILNAVITGDALHCQKKWRA